MSDDDRSPFASPSPSLRVLVFGATGTAGRATVLALHDAGHTVVCAVRPEVTADGESGSPRAEPVTNGGGLLPLDISDPDALRHGMCANGRFDAVVSCLASRTGTPADAWAIDYQAQRHVLRAARAVRASHFVLLSAICVQKPRLAFQHAKLAFERELVTFGIDWSIVRPTAFFKSLSGQVERVRRGKPFLVFGDGRLTACKPIADEDLGCYLAGCLTRPDRRNRILPIGGPGPAITPLEQGEQLFAMLGRKPKYRRVPVALLDTIAAGLATAGRFSSRAADKAEFARIGRYYATESMLLLDPATGRYDAAATPETGSVTLADHYARLLDGSATVERREHAVF